MLDSFLSGSICMGFLLVSMFFLRFWKTTRDRLFLFFSGAFALMLVERILRVALDITTEWLPMVYLLRLAAFVMIAYGILDKNRRK
ncbi:MAG: DUF5985 family protein [Verrucomicrobiota bacterium]